MTAHVPLTKLKRLLLIVWALLVASGFLAEGWRHVIAERVPLSRFFSLSCEQNLPTWYVSSLLLLCSMQLALIARSKWIERAGNVLHWSFLAVAFGYISIDETVTIHEHASNWFDFDGVLYYGWVIPATAIVAVMGACYLRFLARLPRRTRWQFVIAGSLYVGGALGIELPLGWWADIAGSKNLTYGLIDLVEESLELLGVTLFVCALGEILAGPSGELRLILGGPRDFSGQPSCGSADPIRIAS